MTLDIIKLFMKIQGQIPVGKVSVTVECPADVPVVSAIFRGRVRGRLWEYRESWDDLYLTRLKCSEDLLAGMFVDQWKEEYRRASLTSG